MMASHLVQRIYGTRILAALEAANGVLTRAAEILGMGRTTLWRKLRQLESL
jgi:transcriptional regulator of acetoin/glycerol metabolism